MNESRKQTVDHFFYEQRKGKEKRLDGAGSGGVCVDVKRGKDRSLLLMLCSLHMSVGMYMFFVEVPDGQCSQRKTRA